MERKKRIDGVEANGDEMRNCPDGGERRKWGKAQWKLFGLIFSVSAVCLAATAVAVYCIATDFRCVFLSNFGVPCPGCGLTRANMAFLRGDVVVAFGYHPLFFMPQLIAVLGVGYGIFKRYRRWLLVATVVCAVAFIAVWAVRVSFFGWRG